MGVDSLWQPWHLPSFDTDKYLYHYTSIEKAFKILHSKTLRLSSFTTANDTAEGKPRIDFGCNRKKGREIIDYFNGFRNYARLLCFCRDVEKAADFSPPNRSEDDLYYYDVTGRGFALPRMWAQYSGNNTGVCFIFDKKALLDAAAQTLDSPAWKNVQYCDIYKRFPFTDSDIASFSAKIASKPKSFVTGYDFIKNNPNFMKYNYFIKNADWYGEREFRIVTFADTYAFYPQLQEIFIFLKGIVIGENVDSTHANIIKHFADGIEVKKIYFTTESCRFKELHDEFEDDNNV